MKNQKFKVVNGLGDTISKHKTLDLANQKLRDIDNVSRSLYSSDVNWLKNKEEALVGYHCQVLPII